MDYGRLSTEDLNIIMKGLQARVAWLIDTPFPVDEDKQEIERIYELMERIEGEQS